MPVLWQHLSPSTLVLWLHDCESDIDPPEEFPALLHEMVEAGCRYIWVGLNKQDGCKVGKETLDYIRQAYQEEFAKYDDKLSKRILRQRLCPKVGNDDTFEVLEEIYTTVMNVSLEPPKQVDPVLERKQLEVMEQNPEGQQLLLETAITNDTLDTDTFCELFLNADLPVWGHYYYLKAAYHLILSSEKNAFQQAADFKLYLQRLKHKRPDFFKREGLPKGPVDNPFNTSVTVFWILQMQLAIRNYRVHTMAPDLPSRSDFCHVLRHSPSLMNSYPWDEWYSSPPAFTCAKDIWFPPNLKVLSTDTHYRSDPAVLPVDDRSPERVFRYVFAVLRYIQRAGVQREETMPLALETLKQNTMRVRTQHPSLVPYSETQARFWIQIVDAALRGLDDEKETDLTFQEFQDMFDIELTCWRKHYSKRVWDGVSARWQSVPPDLEPLPVVISPVSFGPEIVSEKSTLPMLSPKLPYTEELSFYAAMVIKQTENSKSVLPITNHADLLSYLYTVLVGKQDEKRCPNPEAKEQLQPLTLGQKAESAFAELSSPLAAAATHRNFWIQQVAAAVLHAEREGLATFPEFITSNLRLAWEGLPGVYYSAGVWTAARGGNQIVPGDRRRVPTIVDLDLAENEEDWVHC